MRNWTGYAGDYPGTLHTPNIDALAARSTRYLNAYAAVPLCAGSRTTVLLGQSPATHRVDRMAILDGRYREIYRDPATVSLPEVLARQGYYTAGSGKVFHSPEPARWDEQGPAVIISRLPDASGPGPDGTNINHGVLAPGAAHPDQVVASWARGFLQRYDAARPFFLAVGFYQPHLPWRVPQWAYDLYRGEEVRVHRPPAGDLDDEPAQAVTLAMKPLLYGLAPQYEAVDRAGMAAAYTRAYLAALTHTDAMLGQVLAALAESAHAANTDIILWSDHGFHLGEKFHWQKSTFWEPAVRVPLLVSAPGNPAYPVADVTHPVSLLDLAPTVLDLAGLPPFAGFEGLPLREASADRAVEIYLEGGRATVQGGIKTIDYDLSAAGPGDRASYDLVADPGELDNLLAAP